MKTASSFFSLGYCCLVLLAPFLALEGQAQPNNQQNPRIGYVYPAGGQLGSTFKVQLGGQAIEGVKQVLMSGSGVSVSILEQKKPLTQKQFKEAKERIEELRQRREASMGNTRKAAAAKAEGKPIPTWSREDERTLMELRKKIEGYVRRPENPAIAEKVILEFRIAPDAIPGERELRLVSENGLTNPMKFLVGQLPEVSEAPGFKNGPPANIQVQLPAVINGQIMPGEIDKYRFSAKRGQKLVVSVYARDLIPYLADAVPGWFQAAISLHNAKGVELAYDDDYMFQPDPVLFYTIPEDGEYSIQIKDAIFRGREDFVYRIGIGELPFVTNIFPLGAQAGKACSVEVKGYNLPAKQFNANIAQAGLSYIVMKAGAQLPNEVVFATDTLPEIFEQEPNDQPASAQALSLPVIVNGRISKPGDWDIFKFEGKKGQKLVAEVFARRLDSPLDSVLRITDLAGKEVALNDDHEDKGSGLNTHHADSYIRTELPADGTYIVHLSDIQQKGGQEYAYRLRISQPKPGFELRVAPASVNIKAGASLPMTVYALRKDGFDGAIDLNLVRSPNGFSVSGGRIPPGQEQVRITLNAPLGTTSTPLQISLEGKALVEGAAMVKPAMPAEDMMQAFAYRHLVPAKEILVMVNASQRRGLIQVTSDTPVKIPAGGTARVRVNMPSQTPGGHFDLQLSDPPEGITVEKVNSGFGGTEIVLVCDAAKAKVGLAGNLIVQALLERDGGKNSKTPGKKQAAVPIGMLPAIPFEIIAGK